VQGWRCKALGLRLCRGGAMLSVAVVESRLATSYACFCANEPPILLGVRGAALTYTTIWWNDSACMGLLIALVSYY
jgi:hypothetical protein